VTSVFGSCHSESIIGATAGSVDMRNDEGACSKKQVEFMHASVEGEAVGWSRIKRGLYGAFRLNSGRGAYASWELSLARLEAQRPIPIRRRSEF
jgi:hypothetical protein